MDEHCREILERAIVLLDGEIGILTQEQRAEIESHLEDCAPCLERFGVEKQFLVSFIARLEGCSSPCPDPLRARITSLLDDFRGPAPTIEL